MGAATRFWFGPTTRSVQQAVVPSTYQEQISVEISAFAQRFDVVK